MGIIKEEAEDFDPERKYLRDHSSAFIVSVNPFLSSKAIFPILQKSDLINKEIERISQTKDIHQKDLLTKYTLVDEPSSVDFDFEKWKTQLEKAKVNLVNATIRRENL